MNRHSEPFYAAHGHDPHVLTSVQNFKAGTCLVNMLQVSQHKPHISSHKEEHVLEP